MGKFNFCLTLNSATTDDVQSFEQDYQKVYKPLLTYLYSHPKFCMTFSFSGKQLVWFENNHSEVLDILKELTSRKQVEVLGGGFYDPILPLLFPVDRSGQIEKLTSKLRSTIGKRPRGMSLFGSIWDQSLVTTIQSCSMEYVMLDNTLIPSKIKKYIPVITSEQSKSLKILPSYSYSLVSSYVSFDEWISFFNFKKCKENDCIIPLMFTLNEFLSFMNSNVFEEISEVSKDEQNEVSFTIPQIYLKNSRRYIPSYIPAGMDWNIAQWSAKAYVQSQNNSHFPITIIDFLNTYPQNHKLYERMMYISMQLSQLHGGDKMRKFAAREKLWEAQSALNYVSLPSGLPAVAENRQNSYRLLNEAERLLRDAVPFKESVTSYDYNGDGLNEYICQMNSYNAVINSLGGSISQLDIVSSSGNYAAGLSRIAEFDGLSDVYKRGIFVEHLIEKDEFEDYKNGLYNGNGPFAASDFVERKFESKRHEIHLEGKGEYSNMSQPVSLRKNYTISSDGMTVQYILKNESPIALKAVFVVETNFVQTYFKKDFYQYENELIIDGAIKEISDNASFSVDNKVSFVQISDLRDKMSFVFEPNEPSGFCRYFIKNNRLNEKGECAETSKTLVSSIYWEVDLAAGMEIEKTLNLSIVPSKRKKRNS